SRRRARHSGAGSLQRVRGCQVISRFSERNLMRKSRFVFFAVALAAIAFLTVSYSRSQTPQPGRGSQGRQARTPAGYYADPEWMKTKYGGWGGPGVNGGAGPMDTILLKDWAPKSSAVLPETAVPKARYPAT